MNEESLCIRLVIEPLGRNDVENGGIVMLTDAEGEACIEQLTCQLGTFAKAVEDEGGGGERKE